MPLPREGAPLSGASTTWVLLANGGRARILQNLDSDDHPNLAPVDSWRHDNPPDRDQVTDRPGRFHDDGPHQRSGAGRSDHHEMEKHRFAKDVAERVTAMARERKFDRLVVFAAPNILSDLRENFDQEVDRRLVATVDKDITRQEIGAVESQFRDVMADHVRRQKSLS